MKLYSLSKGGSVLPSNGRSFVRPHSLKKTIPNSEGYVSSPNLGAGLGMISKAPPQNAPIQSTEQLQNKLAGLSTLKVRKASKGGFVRL